MRHTVFSFALFLSAQLIAQTEGIPDMITDRPDQTESAVTVPGGFLQIESGFVYTWDNENEVKNESYDIGGTLLRYGLLDNWEIRVAGVFIDQKTASGEPDTTISTSGMGPLTVGTKVFITGQKGWIPQVAILSHLVIRNSGDEEFSPSRTYPSARIAAAHQLSETLGLGYNLGYSYNGESPAGEGFYSASLGISLHERLGAFVELFGTFSDPAPPGHSADAGLTWQVVDNFQFDASAGIGISESAPDGFVNAGISWRIPR